MAHSVESRMPFMDYRLTEFLFSVPISYKINSGWTKALAREAFKDKLPCEIVYRKDKMGWPSAEKVWFTNQLKDWSDEKILRSNTFICENKIIHTATNSSVEKNKMVSLGTWLKVYFD